jgi:hypothetical protein
VFRIFFIFALGIQHELLEDVIISCDDAAHDKFNQPKPKNKKKKASRVGQPLNAPNFKSRAIVLVSTGAHYLGKLSASYFREVP